MHFSHFTLFKLINLKKTGTIFDITKRSLSLFQRCANRVFLIAKRLEVRV